jgi:hypothetical protein
MVSGIKAEQDIVDVYKKLKIDRELKIIILKIVDTKVEVDFQADNSFIYNDLFEHLPKAEGRFVLINFEYETNENPPRKAEKIIMIQWIPMATPAKQRFVYSSTATSLISELGAVSKHFQASDFSDLDYETLRKECCKA